MDKEPPAAPLTPGKLRALDTHRWRRNGFVKDVDAPEQVAELEAAEISRSSERSGGSSTSSRDRSEIEIGPSSQRLGWTHDRSSVMFLRSRRGAVGVPIILRVSRTGNHWTGLVADPGIHGMCPDVSLHPMKSGI